MEEKSYVCLSGSADLHKNNRTSEWNYPVFPSYMQKSSQSRKEKEATSNKKFFLQAGIQNYKTLVKKKSKSKAFHLQALLKYSKL